jgi:hypothetical protein
MKATEMNQKPAIVTFLLGAALVCHTYSGIRYCDGPDGYRSEEHETGGITYGRDNRGNRWTGHETGGQEYWQRWKVKP